MLTIYYNNMQREEQAESDVFGMFELFRVEPE